MAIRGALLDVDGTLVESNNAHADAWQEALVDAGYHAPFDSIRPLIGMGGDQLVTTLIPSLRGHEQAIQHIAQAHERIFLAQYARFVQPQPGVRTLVEHMKQRGLKLAIATSSHKQVLDVLLRRAGIADLIHEETSANSVAEAKPSPDVVQAALGELRLAASETLMIGDTIYDIESGKRAGVGVIALLCGGAPRDSLQEVGALAIYENPEDLLAHYDASPLAG
jgi:HAD superfamily hydrolase (TIGR01509 family)